MRTAPVALAAALVILAFSATSGEERFNFEHVNLLKDIFSKLQQTRQDKADEFKKMIDQKTQLRDELMKEKQRIQDQLRADREKQFEQVKKVSEEQHDQFKGVLQEILITVAKTEERKLGFNHLELLHNISNALEDSNEDSIRHFQQNQKQDEEHHKIISEKIKEDHEKIKKERNGQFDELTEMKKKQKGELHSMFRDIMKMLNEPKDCADIYRNGNTKSGMYVIRPQTLKENVYVYCDMQDDGGGWTVIQRRDKSTGESVQFNKELKDYQKGFGHIYGQFWLGNDVISALTTQQDMELKVLMLDTSATPLLAAYKEFKVGNEASNYKLKIGGFQGKMNEVLTKSNGQAFTTQDLLTSGERTCALKDGSGWWYPSTCKDKPDAYPNLNGKHDQLMGLDGKTPVIRVTMQIRPLSFNKQSVDYLSIL